VTLFGGKGPGRYDNSQTIWAWQPYTDRLDWIDFGSPLLTVPVISPDGARVAGCTQDGLRIYSLSTRAFSQYGKCTQDTHLAFSPDGQTFVQTASNLINQYSLKDGELLHTLRGHTYPPDVLAYSQNGAWLVSASNQSAIGLPATEVLLWDLDLVIGKKLIENEYTGPETGFSFSMDKAYLFSHTQRRWALADGTILYLRWDYTAQDMLVSPVKDLLAALDPDGSIHFYTFAGSEEVAVVNTQTSLAEARITGTQPNGQETSRKLYYSQDGTVLVIRGAEDTVEIWGAMD
jgi:WD40 repeat protein